MKQIVNSDQELCVGCNRCTRACPIEMANLAYQDENENIKVKIDSTQCIACGECIAVCKHSARYFVDDTEQFFKDLSSGVPISIIAAPSIKTNIYEWRQLFSFLKKAGVKKIYDVSLGADICTWAHLQHIKKEKQNSLITQTCPAIVSYCEKHRHDLLTHLSPIQSPMGCTAIYMRKYENITTKIAALSPCIAKSNEFESTGLVNYNVTYAKLFAYLRKHNFELPHEKTKFDHNDAGLGSLFPSPGGLKENIEYFIGKSIRIDRLEGQEVYHTLNTYALSDKRLLPAIFDVLNCSNGCNSGPGCLRDKNTFEIDSAMDKTRRTVTDKLGFDHCKKLHEGFDGTLTLTDFYRTYTLIEIASSNVSEDAISRSFALLGKDTFAKQNFNCSACGSDSCRDMARKIALKVNLPVNCAIKSRDDARADHQENIKLAKRNAEYIELIRMIGHNLSSINDMDYQDVVCNSLNALCNTLHEVNLYIWRRYVNTDGNAYFKREYEWANNDEHMTGLIHEKQMPDTFRTLSQGNPVIKTFDKMNDQERDLFVPDSAMSTCAVSIIFKGNFWGFTAIDSNYEREYSEEQLSLIASTSMLIVSSIIERELTDNLITAKEEALSNAKAKSEFLSRMSHEMRTPMNAIIGMTKIAERTQDINRLQYCMASINASSTHLLGLINNILDMSKIEAGKFDLSIAPFNVKKMLERTCNILTNEISKKKINLLVSFEKSMPLDYIGDDLRLSQIITNLLSNAVKFTPEYGSVTLRISHTTYTSSSILRFSVSDTGIGMTSEQIKRLFFSFEQADGSISRRFGGTGLGLAISKNIVEKMKGSISVTSEVNKGSTFVVEVPLERTHLLPTSPQDESEPLLKASDTLKIPDFSGITLLLVEDIEINREVFTTLLSDTNIIIDIAENGAVALGKFQSNPNKYDIIIMDIQMPDMDGIEATKRIRALDIERADQVPIIALTANAFKEDVEECLACGMNDHLAKPIDVDMVRRKIRQYTMQNRHP